MEQLRLFYFPDEGGIGIEIHEEIRYYSTTSCDECNTVGAYRIGEEFLCERCLDGDDYESCICSDF